MKQPVMKKIDPQAGEWRRGPEVARELGIPSRVVKHAVLHGWLDGQVLGQRTTLVRWPLRQQLGKD